MKLEEVVLPKFWLQTRESLKPTQRHLLDLRGVADIDLSDPFGQEQFSYPFSVALQRITDSKIILSSLFFCLKKERPRPKTILQRCSWWMLMTRETYSHLAVQPPTHSAELRVGDSLSATNLTSTILVRPLIYPVVLMLEDWNSKNCVYSKNPNLKMVLASGRMLSVVSCKCRTYTYPRLRILCISKHAVK